MSVLMTDTVIIDHDILGWGNEEQKELSKQYRRILKVGQDPELPQRSFDDKVASYCKDNNCDLLTADRTAYTHYFDAGIKTIQMTKYAWWKEGDRPVYLIRIID